MQQEARRPDRYDDPGAEDTPGTEGGRGGHPEQTGAIREQDEYEREDG
jgi:hypothetical protein